MGSRDQKQQQTSTFTGEFKAPPTTPQIQAFEQWQPDDTLLDSGVTAAFGDANRELEESTGGYSGILNPVLAARMKMIGGEELTGQKASALADAARQRNLLKLGQLESSARMTAPQYIQTGGTQTSVQSAPSLWGSVISGGLGVAAAF
jgi:hypothetical protein